MNEPLDPPPFHESETDILKSMLISSQSQFRQHKREVGPMLIELEALYHRTHQDAKAQQVRRYRINMNTSFPKP